ncbi:MAG TPA: hypothetical protein VLC71_06090 [Thermomonas sp.]|nr:hypothetical protein [Thermomonas sp.]
MFNLEKHDATITNVNFRKENHGDEKVAAADLSIAISASALLLDTIDKKLRKAFFEKPGKGEQQALPIDGNNLTALAIPYLREQKLDQKFEGYEVTLHSLLDHIEPVFFADVKVKLEKVTFIEGGSIALTLKVSTTIEESDDAPLLAAWRRGEVRVSLTPPTARAEAANDPDGAKSDAA